MQRIIIKTVIQKTYVSHQLLFQCIDILGTHGHRRYLDYLQCGRKHKNLKKYVKKASASMQHTLRMSKGNRFKQLMEWGGSCDVKKEAVKRNGWTYCQLMWRVKVRKWPISWAQGCSAKKLKASFTLSNFWSQSGYDGVHLAIGKKRRKTLGVCCGHWGVSGHSLQRPRKIKGALNFSEHVIAGKKVGEERWSLRNAFHWKKMN